MSVKMVWKAGWDDRRLSAPLQAVPNLPIYNRQEHGNKLKCSQKVVNCLFRTSSVYDNHNLM